MAFLNLLEDKYTNVTANVLYLKKADISVVLCVITVLHAVSKAERVNSYA